MEKSNRHRINSDNKIKNSGKPISDLNRSSRDRDMGCKNRINKHRRHINEFDHQLQTDTINEYHPSYLPIQGQRLFAAMSDPAVCGYPVSHCYPLEPVSLSVGFPLYQAPPPYPHRATHREVISPRGRRAHSYYSKDDPCPTTKPTDEYASLPPGHISDFESDQQRRFSDPGLANAADSNESDSCDSLASCGNTSCVADQIDHIIQENKRLSKELMETKTELQDLRLEMDSLNKSYMSSYRPGLISELVKEVRDATKLKEEMLLSKVKSFVEESCSNLTSQEKKVCSQECEDLKSQLKQVCTDKASLTDRLLRLEEQMKTLMIHNSVQETSRGELLELEKEKLQLRRELQEAVDAKKVAEANITKLERQVNNFRKKLPNGLIIDEKPIPVIINPHSTSAEDTPTESISSSLGSGSIHSPHVTMSGPVTDL
uniref:Uncharacterized protein n=1 Tax=Clastoptera arizonana TaxID=38151 RepID=A0A1B6DDI7_9HEMI